MAIHSPLLDRLEGDWAFVNAALPQLEAFLISQTWDYPLGYQNPKAGVTLRLTVGNIILSLKCLSAGVWFNQHTEETTHLIAKVTDIKEKWKANWKNKVHAELPVRLNQWQFALQEMYEQKSVSRGEFSSHVRTRVILEILINEVDGLSDEMVERLSEMDFRLRQGGRAGAFLWDNELAPVFNKDDYWFLFFDLN